MVLSRQRVSMFGVGDGSGVSVEAAAKESAPRLEGLAGDDPNARRPTNDEHRSGFDQGKKGYCVA